MTVLEYRSGLNEQDDPTRGRLGNWLGWAIYLGMSWTWCIGMFLPVLLVRDYGLWGWVAFTLPNVIGATAMGWVLSRERSREIVARHRTAITAFSLITVAFQLFFLLWLLSWLVTAHALLLIALGLTVVAFVAWRGYWRTVAVATWLASLALALLAHLFHEMYGDVAFWHSMMKSLSYLPQPQAIVPLASVCILGFALCPYLDETFHIARQNLSHGTARLAFTIGFGVVFFSMILFSLVYAYRPTPEWLFKTRWISTHLTIQLAFTIAVHSATSQPKILVRTLAAVALAALATAARLTFASGEEVYRMFMAFYGLVFPAYVWLCMLPTWNKPQAPSRRMLIVFAVAVLLASPMYWMGFIEGRMMWLLPGVGVVLIARSLLIARPKAYQAA